MKLSEAILLGSMLWPQARDAFVAARGSCALGAAAEALGLPVTMNAGPEGLERMWPWLLQPGTCPACDCAETENLSVIMELNDVHGWTRGRIAAWVAEVEGGGHSRDDWGKARVSEWR